MGNYVIFSYIFSEGQAQNKLYNVITSTHMHYLVPSDDNPFPGLKENLGDHRFKDDDGMKMVVI